MLREFAGDVVGGFVIVPGGQESATPTYEATIWTVLAGLLVKKAKSAIYIMGAWRAPVPRGGAGQNAGMTVLDDGVPRLPGRTTPSTHILKPDIRRLFTLWHSAANETIYVLTATNCSLPTARAFYEPLTQACVVRRFDRVARPDGTLGRLVQHDMCQLAGANSEKKQV